MNSDANSSRPFSTVVTLESGDPFEVAVVTD